MPKPAASGLFGGLEPFVTEPGCYDMPDPVYHADPVVGGSLSSTGARLILQSPAKFFYRRMAGSEERRAFDVGRAAHELVLGFGAGIEVVEGDGADPNSWRTDSDKRRVAAVRAEGKTPLTPKDYATVLGMADALRANAEVAAYLANGIAEQAIFARDPKTGTWLRGRVDFRKGENRLLDYKTCLDADPRSFAKSMGKWGYSQQGAFYKLVLRLLGVVGPDAEFLIIAQEKEPPYLCSVIRPDAEAMAYGAALNRLAIDTFTTCVAEDNWPGYPTEPVEISLPGWLVSQYEQMGLEPEWDEGELVNAAERFEAEEAWGAAATSADAEYCERRAERRIDLLATLRAEGTTVKQARELYVRHVEDGTWTDEHTTACLQRWPRESEQGAA
jgi:hypothetical protein